MQMARPFDPRINGRVSSSAKTLILGHLVFINVFLYASEKLGCVVDLLFQPVLVRFRKQLADALNLPTPGGIGWGRGQNKPLYRGQVSQTMVRVARSLRRIVRGVVLVCR